ncbi:hypothetical protein PPERSA_10215 [Pseudocohnilembus persalinus]|uniref:RING-type domain-containing protein n=1 Tax=Pseudocohnilembus persalinus TaxID=266149 RepID=A0A0V0QLK9_PSEPJ|nr:hypothetical protein PPERSA_10215 [Pseudocohnilembus persalinus]|eukprot:KRX03134.1 hypothetical protein PPERSA_10215 [Pseudocohnilembus persalinus]
MLQGSQKKSKSILKRRQEDLEKENEQKDMQDKFKTGEGEKIVKKRIQENNKEKKIEKAENENSKSSKKKEKKEKALTQEQEEDEQNNKNQEQEGEQTEQESKPKRQWTYEGEKNEKGQFHGKGVYTYKSGSRYEGEFQNNKKNGKGVMKWVSNEFYEGEWKDNKRHGHGKFINMNGDVYEGNFQAEKMHGQGHYTHKCGDQYIGNYNEDKMEGEGTYIWVEGVKYEGNRHENKRAGIGHMIYNDGQYKYKGVWENNELKDILEIKLKSKNERPQGLSDQQRKQVKSEQFSCDPNKKNQKCWICMNKFKQSQQVKIYQNCEHVFHTICADILLKKDSKCIICKKEALKK